MRDCAHGSRTSAARTTRHGMAAFRRTCSALAFMPKTYTASHRNSPLNYGLRWDTTFGLFQAAAVARRPISHCRPLRYPQYAGRAARRPETIRTSLRPHLCARQRPGTPCFEPASECSSTISRRMAGCPLFIAVNNSNANVNEHRGHHRSALPDALRHPRHCRHGACLLAELDGRDRLHPRDRQCMAIARYGYPDVTVVSQR